LARVWIGGVGGVGGVGAVGCRQAPMFLGRKAQTPGAIVGAWLRAVEVRDGRRRHAVEVGGRRDLHLTGRNADRVAGVGYDGIFTQALRLSSRFRIPTLVGVGIGIGSRGSPSAFPVFISPRGRILHLT